MFLVVNIQRFTLLDGLYHDTIDASSGSINPVFLSFQGTKVQQKMHIRKQSEKLFIKKIDFIYLTACNTPVESLLASRCVAGCERGVTDFINNFERAVVWAA